MRQSETKSEPAQGESVRESEDQYAQDGEVAPTHIIRFPNEESVTLLTPSQDGALLYVGTERYAIHIGRALDVYFQWWAAPLAVLIVLIAGIRILRCLKNRQRPKVIYCRKCNYELSGTAAAKCSECGCDLVKTPGKQGRSLARRRGGSFVTIAVTLSLLALGMFFMPRAGLFSRFGFRSSWLFQQLESRGYAVPPNLRVWMTAFYAVDPMQGTWMPLFEMDRTFDFSPMISPDGRGILVSRTVYRGPLLEDIELATGRVRRSIHLVGYSVSSADTMVIGYLDKSNEVLAQCGFNDSKLSQLLACDMATGKTRVVASVPSAEDDAGKYPHRRCFSIVQNHPTITYLAYPQFSEIYDTGRFPLYLIAHNGDVLNVVELDHKQNNGAAPVTSCDGVLMWLPSPNNETWNNRLISRYGLQNVLQGKTTNAYNLQIGRGHCRRIRLTADDRLLFIGDLGAVYAFDQSSWSWRAFYKMSRRYTLNDFVIPSDGSWIAAQATRQSGANGFTTDLSIWKTPDTFPKRIGNK